MALVFMLTNSNTSYFPTLGHHMKRDKSTKYEYDNNSGYVCMFAYLHI